MKKKAVALLVALILVLSGCGAKEEKKIDVPEVNKKELAALVNPLADTWNLVRGEVKYPAPEYNWEYDAAEMGYSSTVTIHEDGKLDLYWADDAGTIDESFDLIPFLAKRLYGTYTDEGEILHQFFVSFDEATNTMIVDECINDCLDRNGEPAFTEWISVYERAK